MSPRERTLAAGVVAAVLLLLFKWMVVDAIRDNTLLSLRVEAKREELRIVRERIGQRDRIAALWAPYEARFTNQAPEQAAAEFDRDVRGRIQQSGISTPSGAPRSPTTRGPFSSIPVNYEFACTNENLADLLYALSTYDGFLRVETLLIQTRWRPGEPARDAPRQVTLEVSTLGGTQ